MKRLVVCCDGTWNAADSHASPTNVFRIAVATRKTPGPDTAAQIVLYLRGVGTTGLPFGDVLEGAVGLGIEETIRSAYMFLAQNYEDGDEIFLFGFSRGAFAARSLAGFVHVAGLLKRSALLDIERAWTFYRNSGGARPSDLVAETGLDTRPTVEIKMLGVWDTVGALGIPGFLFAKANARKYGFHSTAPCSTVKFGYHALAIDEHRDLFVPTLWTGDLPAGCEIEQVWFAGVHSDVGGGYKTRELADVSLVWMAERAEKHGLQLDWSCLRKPTAGALLPAHDSESGLFALDKLRPTLRQVCGGRVDVTAFQRLYVPLDEHGQAVKPLNEKLHPSVVQRFGRHAPLCIDDDAGSTKPALYEPAAIAALFDKDSLRADIVVAT